MRRLAICLLAASALAANAAEPTVPATLAALHPIVGAPGTTFEAVVRGKNLQGAVGVWSPNPAISGEALDVTPAPDAKGQDQLAVRLHFADGLAEGAYDLRVITQRGLSNALRVLVRAGSVVSEQPGPHDAPGQSQKLAAWPTAVHGRIAEVGEVDFYAFTVDKGQELLFRTFSSPALDPGLAIYKLTGSWFDASRPTRLAFADEPVEYPGEPTESVLQYRFEEAGEYLIRVNGFWGYGGADQSYALLIDAAPKTPAPWPPPSDVPLWTERTWKRPLSTERMAELSGRSVSEGSPAPITVLDADAEVTKLPIEPPEIVGPTLITGTIERPGDVDRLRFSVKEGDRLVFEIHTPKKSVPELNLLLRVFDADGVEALTNIWSRVNANGNISKQIYPKTAYVFSRAGDFSLEIRDITAIYGDSDMTYSVLVRPWVPHLGEAHVSVDRLNLVAGAAQSLSVQIDQEEGFDGLAIFSIEGLPQGVEAVMAAEVDPDSPPPFNEGKKERFATKNQKATFALITSHEAPLTSQPQMARIYVRPSVAGKVGEKILAKELPVMVVSGVPEVTTAPTLTGAR